MCGILAVIRDASAPAAATTAPLVVATHEVRHRGPDDEGYMLWHPGAHPALCAGPETARATRDVHRLPALPTHAPWRVGFGHRRLSIVDLSPAGHQPMMHLATGLTVGYNGEIYNHVELRAELERLGHVFASHCDTEVLLVAWAQWGPACLQRLNGMFAFVLLDPRDGGTVHVVRDRFGVKPLYWARVGGSLVFASEIKQIRAMPGFAPRLDRATAADYLGAGLLDVTAHTFDANIRQLLGGERAVVSLGSAATEPRIERWYALSARPFDGTAADAALGFAELLGDSVRLRLRADVPVGSCLSGGLDSSAIVCLAERVLAHGGAHEGQVTVTARFADPRFDEWNYARQVIERSGARSVEVWPAVEELERDLDEQLWYMDEPFGSTSQFSQWRVFAAAKEAGLTVMLDGQGSDEQLAGYPGTDAALYAGLLRRGRVGELAGEMRAFGRRHGRWPSAQLLLGARTAWPMLDRIVPARLRAAPTVPAWVGTSDTNVGSRPVMELARELEQQTLATSLPVLLRYEDRNSMARSIESRVPFLDYRLVEFVRGLPDESKVRRGVTKVVLRDAMRGIVPDDVLDRRDKMGFVTPEETWLRESATSWFRAAIADSMAAAGDLVVARGAGQMVEDVIHGRAPFSFAPWRILCFGRWLRQAGYEDARVMRDGAAYAAR